MLLIHLRLLESQKQQYSKIYNQNVLPKHDMKPEKEADSKTRQEM